MSRNQTFSVSLNLLTKNFQNGVKTIQTSLNNLKMQFRNFAGALGAGLGLAEMVRNMIDSARKLDKAQAVLRNVSDGMGSYADNQEFVMNLSNKYNQELTVLIANFAKYHATANQANISLEEQKYIFEALTRASAYFNLSADETNGVMLAITQMMSKGRVSSEELRRQLGERLPGAMGIMAKAMGVTNSRLEEMLKNGELLAADALPKFARELNGITKNINVDNIEGATNQLRNAFTNLTTKLNVGGMYKNLLNGLSSAINYITENLKNVGQTIAITLGSIASKPLIQKAHTSWTGFFNSLQKQVDAQTKKVDRLRERAMIMSQSSGVRIDSQSLQPMAKPIDPKALRSYEKLKNLADDYGDELKILGVLQDQLNNKVNTMGKRVKDAAKNFLKMAGIQAIYYAIAVAITTIITKLVSWYKEQKRIRDIVKDTNKEYDKLSKTLGTDDVELQSAKKALAEATTDEQKEKVIKRINELLGLQGDNLLTIKNSNEEINNAIDERLKLLEKERQYQAAKQILAEKQSQRDILQGEKEDLQEQYEKKQAEYNQAVEDAGGVDTDFSRYLFQQLSKLDRQIKAKEKEIAQLDKVIEDYGKKVSELGYGSTERQSIINGINVGNTDTGDLDDTVEKQYEKIQKEHNNTLRALNDQYKDNVLTKKDYDDAVRKLYFSTLESIYALDDINENTDKFAKVILENVQEYLKMDMLSDETNKALAEYDDEILKVKQQFANGLITQEELDDKIFDLTKQVLENIAGFGKLNDAAEELAEQYKKEKKQRTFDNISKESAPQIGNLETRLNYKKSESKAFSENAELLDSYAKDLEDYIERIKEYKKELSGDDLDQLNKYIEELEGNLGTLSEKATSFAEAAVFAEVQEDIQNMKKELRAGIWENITGIATAAERLTNSFKSLREIWKDPEVDGWEKFINIFTTIMSIIETCVSVVKTFQAAMAVAESLSLATAAAEQAGIPIKIEDMVATRMQAAAAKELAVARHMAAAASVPYPANLAAIASTSAALIAAFAAIPAFAQGGVVEGASSVGDRNLIRVNGGEAVLTKGQQATLWKLLDGQTSMMQKGGALELKVRGSDLVAVLNNYQKKISK